MFRKVLKHDVNAVIRIWSIITITVLLFSVIGGLCIRGMSNITNNATVESSQVAFLPLLVLGIVISVLSIAVYGFATTFLVLIRFYQNFFTDEAYLTFTLPVKRSTLFNSKLLCAFIFNTATAIVTIVAVGTLLAISPGGIEGSSALEVLFSAFELPIEYIEMLLVIQDQLDFWIATYITVAIIYFIVLYIHETMLLFCTITFGSLIAKKHKVILSIAVFYGIQMMLSVFWAIMQGLMNIGINAAAKIPDFLPGAELFWIILGVLIIYICILAMITAFLYKFTLSKLRGNLNLA